MAIKRAPAKPLLTQGDLLQMPRPEGVRETVAQAHIQPARGVAHPGNGASLREKLGIDREADELERKLLLNVDALAANPGDPRWIKVWLLAARVELLRGLLGAEPGALERRAAELQATWTAPPRSSGEFKGYVSPGAKP